MHQAYLFLLFALHAGTGSQGSVPAGTVPAVPLPPEKEASADKGNLSELLPQKAN